MMLIYLDIVSTQRMGLNKDFSSFNKTRLKFWNLIFWDFNLKSDWSNYFCDWKAQKYCFVSATWSAEPTVVTLGYNYCSLRPGRLYCLKKNLENVIGKMCDSLITFTNLSFFFFILSKDVELNRISISWFIYF